MRHDCSIPGAKHGALRVVESLMTEPCDLFLVVGADGTSMDQLSCTSDAVEPRGSNTAIENSPFTEDFPS